jgi:proteasome lid subunit RPN8/RPN11
LARSSAPPVNEQCWVLTGEQRGRVWLARRMARTVGLPAKVEFDAAAALAREERRGDVIGFWHTHPSFTATPSARDVATMQAWVSAFGKPLLCLIEGTDGLVGYCFDSHTSRGERVANVEKFARGVVVVVIGAEPE